MRLLRVLGLVTAILLCPFVCGVANEHAGAQQTECPNDDPCESGAPIHCPAESGNCVCQGAIRATDVRVGDLDSAYLSMLTNVLLPAHHIFTGEFLVSVSLPHTPFALTASADSLSVCALLQIFRC